MLKVIVILCLAFACQIFATAAAEERAPDLCEQLREKRESGDFDPNLFTQAIVDIIPKDNDLRGSRSSKQAEFIAITVTENLLASDRLREQEEFLGSTDRIRKIRNSLNTLSRVTDMNCELREIDIILQSVWKESQFYEPSQSLTFRIPYKDSDGSFFWYGVVERDGELEWARSNFKKTVDWEGLISRSICEENRSESVQLSDLIFVSKYSTGIDWENMSSNRKWTLLYQTLRSDDGPHSPDRARRCKSHGVLKYFEPPQNMFQTAANPLDHEYILASRSGEIFLQTGDWERAMAAFNWMERNLD